MKSNDDIKKGPEPAKGRMFEELEPHSYEEWAAEAKRVLKGIPLEKKLFTETVEGITLRPIYHKEDIADIPHVHAPSGFSPYVRGNEVLYRDSKAWEIAQEIKYPDITAFNSALRHDLSRGLTAITIPLDTATKLGLDMENDKNVIVGDVGLSILAFDDFKKAFDGIDLAKFPLFIDCGISGLPLLGFYVNLARKQNVGLKELRGSVGMDPIGFLVSNGKLPIDIDSLYDELADMTVWASEHAPKLGIMQIHGETYNNGGASAVQELAYALSTAVEYMRELEKRNIVPEKCVPHFRFSFGMGSNFFMEISKLRAARLLWNKITRECGLSDGKRKMYIHARTSNYTKTYYDPHVNMLRVTIETFAAVAAGAESVHTATFDEQIRPSDEFARRIARNVQLILKEESHLSRIMDPAGGTWYVEHLTNDIAGAAWKEFMEIEKMGGIYKALIDGYPQTEVAKIAEKRANNYAFRNNTIVGTNKYSNPDEEKLNPHPFDYGEFKKARIDDLKKIKNSAGQNNREKISKRAKETLLTEAAIDAADIGLPVSDIISIIRKDKQPSTSIAPIPELRASGQYEKLRNAVESHREEKGNLKVFMATLGPIRKYMPRLNFSASFYEVGGFEVIRTMGFDSPEDAANSALEEDANVIVICGLDACYPEMAPVTASIVKKKKPDAIVIMAGLPPNDELKKKYEAAGVDQFIHLKSNVLQTLTEIASRLGVTL
jgi:methylmalonyl-CoA mutase